MVINLGISNDLFYDYEESDPVFVVKKLLKKI